MAEDKNNSVDIEVSGANGNGRKKWIRIFLIASAGVLVAVLAVCAVLLTGSAIVTEDRIERVMEFGTALKGVSVSGVDISGMTEQEARDATADVSVELLDQAKFIIDVNDEILNFTAEDFGIYTDYEEIVAQALAYGHTGSFDERKQAADTARADGADFAVDAYIDQEKTRATLTAAKNELDTPPQDASCTFAPWGIKLEDNTPYQPDEEKIRDMVDANAGRDDFDWPELVRIADADMPIKLRYQYYQDSRYIDDYRPKDANVARFIYNEAVTGLVVDMDAVEQMVIAAVENDDYSTITAPVEVTEPAVELDEIKQDTRLIASWTSSYSSHYGYSRNYNVGKLSSIINGVIIQPGETWSINEEAGPRTSSGGWKLAPGISGGRMEDEPGGGVCQISSTTYNVALRAGLEIPDSSRHSIVSNYIPIGLDATISTGAPDLKLKNPYGVPIYIISYVNGEEKNVTVEIYGPPLVDDQNREIIYDFTSKKTGSIGTPGTTVREAKRLPDGTKIPPGETMSWVSPHSGAYATVWKHVYLAADGSEVSTEEFYKTKYAAIRGISYHNPAKPAPPSPTDEPEPDPTDEPEPDPTDEPDPGDGGGNAHGIWDWIQG